MPSRLLPPAAVVLAAVVLFAAGVPLAARAADSCGLLSTKQIAEVANDPSIKAGSGINADCIWSGKKTTVYISVRDSGTWANGKAAFQKYGKTESISGVGSDAFFMGPDDPKPTLYALKGAHFIILRVNGTGFSNEQTKSALKTLGNQALAGL